MNFHIVILTVTSFLLINCGLFTKKKSHRPRPPSETSDLTVYPILLEIKELNQLSPEKQELVNKINNNEPVSFSAITRLLVADQISYYNAINSNNPLTEEKANEFIEALVSAQATEQDPHNIKVKYEEKIAEINGSDARYNAQATTLGHVINDNLLQAYSGTIMNQVIWRHNPHFRQQHPVIIFESHHMLPGYMQEINGDWHLFGIETTVRGPAKVEYGAVNNLKKSLRIVDAELFAVTELFKFNLTAPIDLANDILRLTAEKYHITVMLSTYVHTQDESTTGLVPDQSPFQFDYADNHDTSTIERPQITSMKQDEPRGEQPNSILKKAEEQKKEQNPEPIVPKQPQEQPELCHANSNWLDAPKLRGCYDQDKKTIYSYPISISEQDITTQKRWNLYSPFYNAPARLIGQIINSKCHKLNKEVGLEAAHDQYQYHPLSNNTIQAINFVVNGVLDIRNHLNPLLNELVANLGIANRNVYLYISVPATQKGFFVNLDTLNYVNNIDLTSNNVIGICALKYPNKNQDTY